MIPVISPALPVVGIYRVWTLLKSLALRLLPLDPFTQYIDGLGNIPLFDTLIGWLNWFIPMEFIVRSFQAFLGCYVAYILISSVLRLLKIVGG